MSAIISRVINMGLDPNSSFKEIDAFVDECISFLMRESKSLGINLNDDIFNLEEARQAACNIRINCFSSSETS